jgi:hypothetical protein
LPFLVSSEGSCSPPPTLLPVALQEQERTPPPASCLPGRSCPQVLGDDIPDYNSIC